MIVAELQADGRISYRLILSSGELFDAGRSRFPVRPENLDAVWHLIDDAAQRDYYWSDEAVQTTFLHALRTRCAALFEDIVSDDLRREMVAWPDRTLLQISSDDEFVPWELLHDGAGFLGQRFRLVRLPILRVGQRGTDRSGQRATALAPNSRVLHVVGDGIPAQYSDALAAVFDYLPTSSVAVLPARTPDAVTAQSSEADVLHFTCHGDQRGLLLESSEPSPLGIFGVDSVRDVRFVLKRGCLVFANACDSGAGKALLGRTVAFGSAFWAKGASVFIGVLGPIPTETALRFSTFFYRGVFAGGEVLEAFHSAGRSENGGLGCLFYTFYGNPTFMPTQALARRSEISHPPR